MKLHHIIVALICLHFTGVAQVDDAARKRNFNLDMGVALKEFDPISYFHGKPVKGSSKFEYDYKGVIYYFANEANREEFKTAPAKFEPAYGGWCAETIAETGERVKIDPTCYVVSGGRLYLFYNFKSDNRKLKWQKDEKKAKAAADKHWVARMH